MRQPTIIATESWIQGSSHNTLSGFDVRDNLIAGVYLGCSYAGPGLLCAPHTAASTYNAVSNGSATTSSTAPTEEYGIAIDQGDSNNKVVNTVTQFNSTYDLYDANADCGTNFWIVVTFAKSNPSTGCIP
jgi:hypothetical protein